MVSTSSDGSIDSIREWKKPQQRRADAGNRPVASSCTSGHPHHHHHQSGVMLWGKTALLAYTDTPSAVLYAGRRLPCLRPL